MFKKLSLCWLAAFIGLAAPAYADESAIWIAGDSFAATIDGEGIGLELEKITGREVKITGVPGSTLEGAVARVIEQAPEHQGDLLVFIDGSSNGFGWTSNDLALYEKVREAFPQSIIVPPVKRANDRFHLHWAIEYLQDGIRERFPGQTIDAQEIMAAAAATEQDRDDVRNGVVPSSLMQPDKAHPNTAGAALLAKHIADLIAEREW